MVMVERQKCSVIWYRMSLILETRTSTQSFWQEAKITEDDLTKQTFAKFLYRASFNPDAVEKLIVFTADQIMLERSTMSVRPS